MTFTSGFKILNPVVEYTANQHKFRFVGDAGFDDYTEKEVCVMVNRLRKITFSTPQYLQYSL